jgi:hypothetical protein
MELIGEVMLFGIVEGIVSTIPIEIAAAAFNRRPLRLVLTGNLVPKGVILRYTTTSFYITSGRDVSQELIGIR